MCIRDSDQPGHRRGRRRAKRGDGLHRRGGRARKRLHGVAGDRRAAGVRRRGPGHRRRGVTGTRRADRRRGGRGGGRCAEVAAGRGRRGRHHSAGGRGQPAGQLAAVGRQRRAAGGGAGRHGQRDRRSASRSRHVHPGAVDVGGDTGLRGLPRPHLGQHLALALQVEVHQRRLRGVVGRLVLVEQPLDDRVEHTVLSQVGLVGVEGAWVVGQHRVERVADLQRLDVAVIARRRLRPSRRRQRRDARAGGRVRGADTAAAVRRVGIDPVVLADLVGVGPGVVVDVHRVARDGARRADGSGSRLPRRVGGGVADANRGQRAGQQRVVGGLLRQRRQAGVLTGDELGLVEAGELVRNRPVDVLLQLAGDLRLRHPPDSVDGGLERRHQARVEIRAGITGHGAAPLPARGGGGDLDAAEEFVGVGVVDPGELLLRRRCGERVGQQVSPVVSRVGLPQVAAAAVEDHVQGEAVGVLPRRQLGHVGRGHPDVGGGHVGVDATVAGRAVPGGAPPAVRQEDVVDLDGEVVALLPEVDAAGQPGHDAVADLVEPLLVAVERGREDECLAAAFGGHQEWFNEIGHGIVTWLTRGIHLGQQRNYFAVQVDDVFLPDSRWSATGHCTPGDGCVDPNVTTTDIRMTPADVTKLAAWQNTNGFALDMVFNGGGSELWKADPANNGRDLLADAFTAPATQQQFTWINHTYTHEFLGCIQIAPTTTGGQWRCAVPGDTGPYFDPSLVPTLETTVNGIRWMSQAEITSQLQQNIDWAVAHKLTHFDKTQLVTGEHSGLATLPQQPTDSPLLAGALSTVGIGYTASDASRESAPRTIGSTSTVPRHPMNIYYNSGTYTDEVSEYNWIYTDTAHGGSGICTAVVTAGR